MKKSLLFLLLLSLITVSCSGNKADEEVVDDTAGIEMEDASDAEFEEEEVEGQEVAEVSDEGEAEPEEVEQEEVEEVAAAEEIEGQEEVQINESAGQMATYTVEKNETLMWIAFKIYGDYAKWKELREMNSDIIQGQTVIAGSQLKYVVPEEDFVYNPQGNPYLIKKEDTLGTISADVYGTPRHWKYIWENNQRQIKNPNLIFAGFTIYYLPLRDVANE